MVKDNQALLQDQAVQEVEEEILHQQVVAVMFHQFLLHKEVMVVMAIQAAAHTKKAAAVAAVQVQ